MALNTKLMEINGPFSAREDIFTLLKVKYPEINFSYISKLGIYGKTKHEVRINGKDFELGKTGMLEFSDVQITSLFFLQNEDYFTIVDCIVV